MKKVASGEARMREMKKAIATGGTRTKGRQIVLKDPDRPSRRKPPHDSMKGTDARYKSALRSMERGGDVGKAHALLEAAAGDGDALSIYALGTWRLHGFFLSRNVREATRLSRLAAEADIAYACFDLGFCYQEGLGVKKDLSKATKYFLRAFLLGDDEAAAALESLFYWYGGEINLRIVSREFVRSTKAG